VLVRLPARAAIVVGVEELRVLLQPLARERVWPLHPQRSRAPDQAFVIHGVTLSQAGDGGEGEASSWSWS